MRLLEWFDYRGHVCMVFERLGLSLYDFMRKNAYKPFPLDMVRLSSTLCWEVSVSTKPSLTPPTTC